MAIVQISQITQRTGNLVDLPQLAEAEFGWASDEKRLFIGKETPNENIEVLTSYSTIDFNQIEGSVGNLNISPTPLNGQILTYDGTNWVNRGRGADGLITLGDVYDIKIDGGAIGYVLQTDGLGNLSWAPKGALYTNIIGLSDDDPIVMTVANTTPYTNDAEVTITGVVGASNTIVNGQSFYIQLAEDFATSGNVTLYTSVGGVGPVDGTGLEYDNAPDAIATSLTGGTGGGGAAAGTTYSVQYNDNNILAGAGDFTWNFNTKVLTVGGNANVGNLNATGIITAPRLVSNVSTGTAPLTVSSTTVVANLNADRVDGFDASISSSANTIVVRNANGNIAGNTIVGNTISGNLSGTLVATSSAQPNVTSLGTLTVLDVNGNITAANITANTGVFSGNGQSLFALNGSNISVGVLPVGRLSGTYSISITGSAATVTTAAQPNITSVGTLTDISTSGNISVGGNVAIVGNLFASLLTGTLSAFSSSQPNVTSVGTLTSLGVTGNITGANITTSNHVIRGVNASVSAAGSVQNNATLLTKDINVVTTVSAGEGVRLPVAVAGMVIIVNNASAETLNVYPSSGAAINSLATNASYTHVAGASLQYYAISNSQWYTIGATYA